MVKVENLSKNFTGGKKGPVLAVQNVSFQAQSGKIFGLLGANGAGKTTTLRMLSTVLTPTSGRAEIAGYDINTHPQDVRRSIGFLSTSTALYNRLNPIEMLQFIAKLYSIPEDRAKARIEEVVSQLNIEPFADRLCDKLSTGQKQRVSIARAILHDPPVLFFDEPTAGLDVVTSQTILEFIESARSLNKTVIFSTHIMTEAERLCDEIAIIHEGRLCAQGTNQELLAKTGATSLEKAFLKVVEYAA